MPTEPTIAIIGAGPAGLMAAQICAQNGAQVAVYDAMPSFGRKFLMAGKSGLNITHSEPSERFLARYRAADPRLLQALERFDASDIRDWMGGLGIAEYVGSTGRVFPEMMKASPLLRAWLQALRADGVAFHTRHAWTGWDAAGTLRFSAPDAQVTLAPQTTILALGGGSWRRLGSDGLWQSILQAKGVETSPFSARNCGFKLDWSEPLRTKWAGAPLKGIGLTLADETARGECVITERGIEGGVVYTLSAAIQETLQQAGHATLKLDLFPQMTVEALATRLSRPRGKATLSNFLRKSVRINGVKLALIYETSSKTELAGSPQQLAARLKSLPLHIVAPAPIDEAISTAGGVAWSALTDQFELKTVPGVFCAGEMIAWDAPTGGYLLSACFATGRAAAAGALAHLARKAVSD